MNSEIREKLHHFIDSIEDKKAQAIYILFKDEIENDTDLQRRKLVKAEREKYLNGEGTSYHWNEVKEMALNKGARKNI